MGVTKRYSKGYWWRQLSVIVVVSLMYCGLVMHSVYAAEVAMPTLTLTLQDENGLPIAGVDVSAMEGDFVGKKRDGGKTDENGTVVFKHLPSGTYYFFANIKAIHSHVGYGLPALTREFKTARSYYISESKSFDLSANVECTYKIKKKDYIWFETFLDLAKPEKIALTSKKMGIQQIIPVDDIDFIQLYIPMGSIYQITTIKDKDFDSWILDFYAHEGLRIELL